MLQHIAKFNPYNMDDETVLALATGRKQLLGLTLQTLEENLQSDGGQSHLLIYGPRGMGKSFFLKYLGIKFRENPIFKNADFVSFPEEQSNVKCTTDFIKMVLAYLKGQSFENVTAIWEETDEVWEAQLTLLINVIQQKRQQFPQYTLVVVMENINEFLDKLRSEKKQAKIKEARFRHLLENVEGLTLIGASPRANIDSNYNKRLFKAWKTLKLKPWGEEAYHKYFERRYQLEVERTGKELTPAQYKFRQDKLRAIHKYTGGSPRMAVVLSNLLLEDDAISTAQTLYGLIDDLTPYYQNLTSTIPDRPRQIMDTLIRLGENKSQSEIATYLGTSQNSVSRHFLWLQDNGYILGQKRSNSKQFRYYLADRIYVLFYQDREVFHGQNYTPVWLLSDFLVSFYQVDELVERAVKYLDTNPTDAAFDFARIGLKAAGLPQGKWPKHEKINEWKYLLSKIGIDYVNEKSKNLLHEIFLKESDQTSLNILTTKLSTVFESLIETKEEETIFAVEGILFSLLKKYLEKNYIKSSIYLLEKIYNEYRVKEIPHLKIAYLLSFNYVVTKQYKKAKLTIESNIISFEESFNEKFQHFKYNWRDVYVNALENLNEHEKALNEYKKILRANQEKGDTKIKVDNLSKIGYLEREILNDEKSLDIFHKITKLDIVNENKNWAFGQMSVQYFLINQETKAWKILNREKDSKEKVFKQFGDAVFYTEKRKNRAKAFELGNKILHELKERKIDLNYPMALSMFFANLLTLKISTPLFQELCESALKIYTNPHEQVVLSAALYTAEYIVGGKEAVFLEQLSPDMAIAVKAIVEEGGL